MSSTSDYAKYRGKCREMSEALVAEDSSLTLVRGWYDCPMWGRQAHWWCRTQDGTIVDPTVKQFPTAGVGAAYIEYDGIIQCEQCGKEVHEDDATIDGHHAFCSDRCYAKCIGMEQYL